MRKTSLLPQVALLVLFASGPAAAELKLGSLFQHHMVLQRDMPIKIWGWSDVGDKVVVSQGGKSASAVGDATGKWMATLPGVPFRTEDTDLSRIDAKR